MKLNQARLKKLISSLLSRQVKYKKLVYLEESLLLLLYFIARTLFGIPKGLYHRKTTADKIINPTIDTIVYTEIADE